MSRVNEKNDAERAAEQKRVDKEARAKEKQSGDKFSQLVRQNKEGRKQTTRQPAQTQKQPANAGTQRGPTGNALLARQGITSNSFAAQLYKQGSENLDYSKSLTTNRETEKQETKSTTDEREVHSETQRLDGQQDKVEAVSRDGGRGSQHQGDGGDGGGGEGQSQDDGHQSSQGDGSISKADNDKAAPAEALAGAPQIPEQALRELIKRVLVGVNTEGLSQFYIEFKQDVLGGVRLEVSAENGKIKAKFISEDANVRRLLKASEGQLSRAFGYKGLSLERLEVAEP